MMVGWEINVPFQHKNRLYWRQGLGWRFSSARLRMANDTVTCQPHCLFVQQRPKIVKDGEAHFRHYARTYNRVETNEPPQDLFISSMAPAIRSQTGYQITTTTHLTAFYIAQPGELEKKLSLCVGGIIQYLGNLNDRQ